MAEIRETGNSSGLEYTWTNIFYLLKIRMTNFSSEYGTPTQNNGDLHVWPGSQCLLILELNRVGQAQGQLNGSQTIQQMSWQGCVQAHITTSIAPLCMQQCFKVRHVRNTAHTIHSWPLDEYSQWSVNGILIISPLARIRIKCEQCACGAWHHALLFLWKRSL